jgi:hypothetical protein
MLVWKEEGGEGDKMVPDEHLLFLYTAASKTACARIVCCFFRCKNAIENKYAFLYVWLQITVKITKNRQ